MTTRGVAASHLPEVRERAVRLVLEGGGLHQRRPVRDGGLVHHSDRGWQHLALRHTGRLAEAGARCRAQAGAQALAA